MQKVTTRELYTQMPTTELKDVQVSGWVRTVRDSKAFAFIALSDGTYFKPLQIVLEEGALNNYKEVARLNVGSAIEAVGTLVPTPGMQQPFELKAERVTVVGASSPDYPLQKKQHSVEFLRTIAHLRPRTNLFSAVFRIRSLAAQIIHEFFHQKHFVYVHTPIITTSDCEGAGEMFRITTLDPAEAPRNEDGTVDYSKDFFGKEAGLTVSGQLNVESFCLAFRDVYTFGPTFRAERSFTPRHAAEFWMVEPEIAFATLEDDMDLAEEMVKAIIDGVLKEAPEEMAFLSKFVDKGLIERLTGIVAADFARVSYTEAIDILQKSGVAFEFDVSWGADLQTEHERYLTETHFGRPVFVYGYPKEIKSFYMKLNEDGKTVQATDLLVPVIGELIGASAREDDHEVLEARMRELDLNPEEYWWYLELRKYGSVPHAGFGLGFERMVMYLTGVANIRDVTPFPRTAGTAEF